DWLTRKQKETRRGRAELLLADRASVWNARPENRQLPSLLQWFQIRWLTQKKNWTSPQRRMLQKAGKYHVFRGLLLLVVLGLVSWCGYEVHGRVVAAALVQRLMAADTRDTTKVSDIIEEMPKYDRWTAPILGKIVDESPDDSKNKL